MNEDSHGGLTNDLADWYPVVAATGVPTPATRIIPVPESLLIAVLDGEPFDVSAERSLGLVAEAAAELGVPVFLRTGEMSAKHDWDFSCHVRDLSGLTFAVSNLFQAQAMAFGVPEPTHLVIREMLPTEHLFYAFSGMPITKERRYFVENSHVVDRQPYWPLGAIRGQYPRSPEGPLDDDVWEGLLREASTQTEEEVAVLTALSEQAAVGLTGAWSLDWLWVPSTGWVFTDAAHAEQSYRMPDIEREALR